LAFFAQPTATFCKIDHNIDFEKNANFLAENWQKFQKIVIIASTLGTHVHDFENIVDKIWIKNWRMRLKLLL
jgi:hypothetical protein